MFIIFLFAVTEFCEKSGGLLQKITIENLQMGLRFLRLYGYNCGGSSSSVVGIFNAEFAMEKA